MEKKLMKNEVMVDGKVYRITPKFEKFVEFFTNPKSPTYGNLTQSTIKAYGLSHAKYDMVSHMASDNGQKLKDLARYYGEQKGYSYGMMIDFAMNKMKESKTPDWWDRLMKVMGYMEEKQTKVNVQTNIQNVISKDREKYL